MLNHRRRLTLPRPTAIPTAIQLRVVLTLQFLLFVQALARSYNFESDSRRGSPKLGRMLELRSMVDRLQEACVLEQQHQERDWLQAQRAARPEHNPRPALCGAYS